MSLIARFPFGVLFHRILNIYLPIPQELPVHAFDRRVGSLKAVVRYKSVSLRLLRSFVFDHNDWSRQRSKG